MRATRPLACAALALLAACAHEPPTTQQLAAMSDADLCAAVQAEPLRFDAGSLAADRGLRCHPAVAACDAMGYEPNVPINVGATCVSRMVEQIKQQQAQKALEAQQWQAFGLAMQQYSAQLQAQQMHQQHMAAQAMQARDLNNTLHQVFPPQPMQWMGR